MTGGGVLITALILSGATQSPSSSPTPSPSPAPQAEPAPWTSLLGSGLLTLQDTSTLPPGKFSVAFTVDNRDRDPLGLDLVDGAVAWNLGVTKWIEFFGHHVFSRSVAVPDTPVLPPPPLDAILAPGTTAPPRPYYSLYSPVPYVDDSGPIRFGSDIPGDVVLGLKARVWAPQGPRPGLAFSTTVQFPSTTDLQDLKAGSGTGGIDARLGAHAEWRLGRFDLVAGAGFTRVGRPPFPDRRIEWRNGALVATDEALVLPHRVDLGAGLRRTLRPCLALVGEVTTVLEVGRRTLALDRARPVDVLGGVQFRWKMLRLTAALRHHGNALRSMQVRPAPLAGLVDVTQVSRADLATYLTEIGLEGAALLLRQGAHQVLVPPSSGPPLPLGSRVIPETYRIRSEHQLGFVLLWGLGL